MGSSSAFDKVLEGDPCNETLNGSAGRDKILGGEGHDVINGGDGDDVIKGNGLSKDVDYGKLENGLDRVVFGTNNDHDTISGGQGDDIISGNAGNDRLNGNEDNDTLSGGKGKDTLEGGQGNDKLFGGSDNDHLTGGSGKDYLDGGPGHDTYYFSDNWGDDTVEDSGGKIVFDTTASPKTFIFTKVNNNLLIEQKNAALDNSSVNKISIQNFFSTALEKPNYSLSYKGQSYNFMEGKGKSLLLAGG